MNVWEDIKLFERLTGRVCPIPVERGEAPPLSERDNQRRLAFLRLVNNPDFILFLEFARERALGVLDGKKSDKASELELRKAKGAWEATHEFATMLLDQLKETEEIIVAREKWVAERDKNQQNPNSATGP